MFHIIKDYLDFALINLLRFRLCSLYIYNINTASNWLTLAYSDVLCFMRYEVG